MFVISNELSGLPVALIARHIWRNYKRVCGRSYNARLRACMHIQINRVFAMSRALRTKSPKATVATPTHKVASTTSNRRIQVRRSGVHGKGVFAVQNIAEGEVLIEYVGEVISWQEAQDRHPHDPSQPNHTFYFHVDEDRVIDANFGGNSARWINHCCNPNCYADEQDGRIFITALRNIAAGEELNYDYGLMVQERYTKKLKAEYPCWCGSPDCRGTLLAPKRGWSPPGPAA
jgi:SET domain-containing protein